MVMGFWKLLIFLSSFYKVFRRGREKLICSCRKLGLGNDDIPFGFISIMEQMLDHHGFRELEIIDFTSVFIDSGAVWRGPRGLSTSRCKQAMGRGRGLG